MISEKTFRHFANTLSDTYGTIYDEREEVVECPSCGELIARGDWTDDDVEYDQVISEKIGPGKLIPHIINGWKCPVCGEEFED